MHPPGARPPCAPQQSRRSPPPAPRLPHPPPPHHHHQIRACRSTTTARPPPPASSTACSGPLRCAAPCWCAVAARCQPQVSASGVEQATSTRGLQALYCSNHSMRATPCFAESAGLAVCLTPWPLSPAWPPVVPCARPINALTRGPPSPTPQEQGWKSPVHYTLAPLVGVFSYPQIFPSVSGASPRRAA